MGIDTLPHTSAEAICACLVTLRRSFELVGELEGCGLNKVQHEWNIISAPAS